MQVISTREFRANQKKYFEMAESELVLVSRRNGTPIALVAADSDEFPTKEEFLAIQSGLEDIRHHRTIKIENIKDIWASIL